MQDSMYEIRRLEEKDYELGFIDCINQLTVPNNVTKEEFMDRYRILENKKDYYIFVAVCTKENKIVGCGTLFIEYKFIR